MALLCASACAGSSLSSGIRDEDMCGHGLCNPDFVRQAGAGVVNEQEGEPGNILQANVLIGDYNSNYPERTEPEPLIDIEYWFYTEGPRRTGLVQGWVDIWHDNTLPPTMITFNGKTYANNWEWASWTLNEPFVFGEKFSVRLYNDYVSAQNWDNSSKVIAEIYVGLFEYGGNPVRIYDCGADCTWESPGGELLTPEPATWMLMAGSLGLLAWRRVRA